MQWSSGQSWRLGLKLKYILFETTPLKVEIGTSNPAGIVIEGWMIEKGRLKNTRTIAAEGAPNKNAIESNTEGSTRIKIVDAQVWNTIVPDE